MLSVTAMAGCKKSAETSAKAEPGVAAGKVIEVKGAVTLKHGDATRPLAAGESVEGDDTVITGADGNVVIELAHNAARWELGPNKQQRVRESIAWKAAKSTGPVQHVEQDTAAAGRPAERNAAGTVATADVEEAAPAPAAEAAPMPQAAMAPPEPAREEAKAPRPARRRAAAAAPQEEAAPAEAAMESAPAPVADVAVGGGTRGGARVIAKAAPPAPPPPPAPGGGSLQSVGKGAGGGGTSGAAGAGAPNPTSVRSLLAGKQSQLKMCLADHTDEVKLVVEVSAGKPTVKLTSKTEVSARLEGCVNKVVKMISFEGDGSGTLVLKP